MVCQRVRRASRRSARLSASHHRQKRRLPVTLTVNTGLRWSEQARLGGLTWTCLPGASPQEWSGPACAAQHHRSRCSHGFGDAAPPPDRSGRAGLPRSLPHREPGVRAGRPSRAGHLARLTGRRKLRVSMVSPGTLSDIPSLPVRWPRDTWCGGVAESGRRRPTRNLTRFGAPSRAYHVTHHRHRIGNLLSSSDSCPATTREPSFDTLGPLVWEFPRLDFRRRAEPMPVRGPIRLKHHHLVSCHDGNASQAVQPPSRPTNETTGERRGI